MPRSDSECDPNKDAKMFIESALDQSTPLVLAALGCLLSVRAGIVNIAIEGSMLLGAFAGAAIAASSGSPLLGVLFAALAGTAGGVLLAWVKLHLGADEILAGFAINAIAAGATVTGLFALTRSSGDLDVKPLPSVRLPMLDGIPVLENFAALSPLTWLVFLVVPTFMWMYFNTRTGLWIRAVGDNAPAVVEAGIDPRRVQWLAVAASGLFAGLAGAQLSLFTTSTFVRDMSHGAGFIALGAVYLGLRHPVGTTLAAVAFGCFEALTTVLQTRTAFPTDALLALPYLATVAALVVAGARMLGSRKVVSSS